MLESPEILIRLPISEPSDFLYHASSRTMYEDKDGMNTGDLDNAAFALYSIKFNDITRAVQTVAGMFDLM